VGKKLEISPLDDFTISYITQLRSKVGSKSFFLAISSILFANVHFPSVGKALKGKTVTECKDKRQRFS
jgi:hypothetical protein